MNKNLITDIPLWVLVLLGLAGGLSVSIDNMSGTVCPHIWVIPACYLVTAAYALMFGSLALNNNGCKHYFFAAGWSIAFIIALLASLAEMFGGGGICPSTSSGGLRAGATAGIPLCYVSLVFLIVILILFLKGPYGRACKIHSGK